MPKVNKIWSERRDKIDKALEEICIDGFYVKAGKLNDSSGKIVHQEFYKGKKLVGEVIYSQEPPMVNFYDDSFRVIAFRLLERIRSYK